jgi:hypothetical protein
MLMPTGILGQRPAARRAAKRFAAARAPRLLKPSRLISARFSGIRKMRGRGLPGCACAVSVPISTKPNPRNSQAPSAIPSLSKPVQRQVVRRLGVETKEQGP